MNFNDLKTKPKILIGVCAPLILTAIMGGVSIFNIDQITQTSKWVQHTQNVLAKGASIVASAVDMETGMRGYLLAGKEEFLDPYKGGQKATYERIADLQETVSDNPGQVARLAEVEKTLREWQANVTEPTIQLRRDIGDAATMNDMAKLVGEARGKVYFDGFRGQIATFIGREQELLDMRSAQSEAASAKIDENFELVSNSVGWVDHTNKVLAAANTVLANAVDMETGMRGFLLGGEDEFLEPYNAGQAAFFENIQALQETVSDNPPQVARLQETETLIADWISNVTEPAIKLRRDVVRGVGQMDDVVRLVRRKLGKQYFDAFRVKIAEFVDIERALLVERQAAAEEAEGVVANNLKVMNENAAWVIHTYKVIGHANDILASAVDMETGMRGYLLAGKEEFLDPYKGGSQRFLEQVAGLQETVSDNPAQVQLLDEIRATITEWQTNVTEPTIQLRRDIGDAKTMDDMADLVGEARGKVYFDGFRELMAAFSAEEEGLMQTRLSDNAGRVTNSYIIIGVVLVGALVIGVAVAFFIGNSIATPLTNMTGAMQTLAGGDTSVEVPGTGRGDEIGEMAGTVQVFKDNAIETTRLRKDQQEREQRAEAEKREAMAEMADNFEKSVGGVVQTVSSSATEMQASAETMSGTARQTASRAETVTSAVDVASNNVQSVSSATEELTSSINEISSQVSRSATTSRSAVGEVETASDKIKGLADAVQKIGEVVALITDIADQTNLLALNATIESARAGEAGKGFAVVASEVKNLATQTGKATEEIAAQIESIQGATQDSVKAIDSIGDTIRELDQISTTIASAIEQQGAATQEIARNAEEAASSAGEVSRNIAQVNEAAAEGGRSAEDMLGAAKELGAQAESLKGEVDKFLTQVRGG